MNGILVYNKPSGKTSRDIVNALQRLLPRKTKIGHAGTLDPLATGVLVICIGAATRFVEYIHDQAKSYRTRIRFGANSDTDDIDGNITPREDVVPPTEEEIRKLLPEFTGDIIQTPPVYSAARIDGKRAYELARKGREVSLAPRAIRIDAIRLLEYSWPDLVVDVDCGKGTYIRAIARDLGEKLGCGGMVADLCRTRLGDFTLEMALPPNPFREEVYRAMMPVWRAVEHYPRLEVTEDTVRRIRHGQRLTGYESYDGKLAMIRDEELIAVGDVREGIFYPERVIPAEE